MGVGVVLVLHQGRLFSAGVSVTSGLVSCLAQPVLSEIGKFLLWLVFWTLLKTVELKSFSQSDFWKQPPSRDYLLVSRDSLLLPQLPRKLYHQRLYFGIYLCTWKAQLQRGREKETESKMRALSSICWNTFQLPTTARTDEVEVKSLKLHLILPCGCRGQFLLLSLAN